MISMKDCGLPGIPDNMFARGTVPMTREEIRAITLSKARIGPGLTIWDIGSGTGSISVEAARITPGGTVYAIERSEEGFRLTEENRSRFGISNMKIIKGEAPDALKELPSPDRVIIGGSGGRLNDIISIVKDRMNKDGRLVINAVTLETLTITLGCLDGWWASEVIQVGVSRAQMMGSSRLMKAYNPVYIISAWRCEV